MRKVWKILYQIKEKDQKQRLEEIIQVLLKHRKITTKQQRKDFFDPQNPYKINLKEAGIKAGEVKKAVGRIKKAVKNKELIVVYGDYDADGICATAVLWETLHKLGANAFPFIPLREAHGYGLKEEGVEALIQEYGQPDLIITVDNGIVAFKGAEYCRKQGIDLIISDHHQSRKIKNKVELPEAVAVVHTDQLAGAGVAWFLAREIERALIKRTRLVEENLELAAIGTIADMVPLVGINRSLVSFGLTELKKTERPGLRALFTEARVELDKINTYNVSFIIAPRLNAMGRLGQALDSLRLVCTQDEERAVRLAVNLGSTNKQRQEMTFTALKHAQEAITSSQNIAPQRLLFIAHQSYNQGVIGLVAGKLVERFWRPAIVIAQDKEFSKGSVRSIPGVDIIAFLRQFEDEFVDLGGHPLAAGFSIETAKIPVMQKKLEKLALKEIAEELLYPRLEIECEIKLDDINQKFYQTLELFEPFGIGNKRPVFAGKQVQVVDWRVVGSDEKHLKMRVRENSDQGANSILEAIYFNGAEKAKGDLDLAQPVDVAFQVDENEWNGRRSLQLMVKDVISQKE